MKVENIAPYSLQKVENGLSDKRFNTGEEFSKLRYAPNFGINITKSDKLVDRFLNNKFTQKVFDFANINPFGFTIANLMITCMLMRPVTTLAIPGASKDDKQYLAAKSFISSAIANGFRLALCLPLAKSIEKLGKRAAKAPEKIKFPAEGTKKFDALNYGINNGFAVVLGFFTSALMVYAVGKVMNKVEELKNKTNRVDDKNIKLQEVNRNGN